MELQTLFLNDVTKFQKGRDEVIYAALDITRKKNIR